MGQSAYPDSQVKEMYLVLFGGLPIALYWTGFKGPPDYPWISPNTIIRSEPKLRLNASLCAIPQSGPSGEDSSPAYRIRALRRLITDELNGLELARGTRLIPGEAFVNRASGGVIGAIKDRPLEEGLYILLRISPEGPCLSPAPHGSPYDALVYPCHNARRSARII